MLAGWPHHLCCGPAGRGAVGPAVQLAAAAASAAGGRKPVAAISRRWRLLPLYLYLVLTAGSSSSPSWPAGVPLLPGRPSDAKCRLNKHDIDGAKKFLKLMSSTRGRTAAAIAIASAQLYTERAAERPRVCITPIQHVVTQLSPRIQRKRPKGATVTHAASRRHPGGAAIDTSSARLYSCTHAEADRGKLVTVRHRTMLSSRRSG